MLREWKDYVFPNVCLGCEKEIPKKDYFCVKCSKEVEKIKKDYCVICGKPHESLGDICFDCKKTKRYFDKGRGMFVYYGIIKENIAGSKFFSKTWIVRKYGEMLALYYQEEVKNDFDFPIDMVLPVPISKKRRRKRGYNQTEILGKAFSIATKIPMHTDIMIRVKETIPQKELSNRKRKENIKNAFDCLEKTRDKIVGKNLLIVDDIYTTGTTINEIAYMLKQYGANKVYFLTVAIGSGL